MKFSKLFLVSALAVSAVAANVSVVSADVLGLANGRSANMDNLAGMSVEAGYTSESDISTLALRFNFKVSPDLMIYGDVGQTDLKFVDGMAFGAGAFYQLRNVNLLENTDLAVKFSYHTMSIDESGCATVPGGFNPTTGQVTNITICDTASGDLTEMAIGALLSGDQLSTTDFGWYANIGMHKLDGPGGDENELNLGGGIVGSLSFGDWYAGLDLIDEMFLRVGVRYNLQ